MPPARDFSILDGGRIIWFLLDSEANLSTWFSSVTLLVAAALSLLCMAGSGGDRRWWSTLAVLLVGLSFDETATAHEYASKFLVTLWDPGGILSYLWVVPVPWQWP